MKVLPGVGMVVLGLGLAVPAAAQVTFTKDIAPVLQRSCQNCHRPDGVAPMSLVTYEEVRPYARAIKQRTSIGPHRGVMPPWYIEKNVGIQKYKNDPSLSDAEIAMIGKWAAAGAQVRRREHVADRSSRSDREDGGADREGERAGLVGRDPVDRPGPDGRPLRRRAADPRGQRRPEQGSVRP